MKKEKPVDQLSPTEAMNQFQKHFNQLTYRHSPGDVFTDFIDYTFLMLDVNKKPEDFKRLDEKYKTREEALEFVQMLDLLGIASEGFHDVLGDLFMDLVSHGQKGQFFSPPEICDMMAVMTIPEDIKDGATVLDCAAGSGRMLLGAAKINRKLHFTASDIDHTCVKMCVINFMLNTMVGDVVWMNTLSLEHFKTYRINKVLMPGGQYLPYYVTLNENPMVVQKIKESLPKIETTAQGLPIPTTGKHGQLIMF